MESAVLLQHNPLSHQLLLLLGWTIPALIVAQLPRYPIRDLGGS